MSEEARRKPTGAIIGTALLWLLFNALGTVAVYSVNQLAVMIFAVATSQNRSVEKFFGGVLTGQITALVAGAVWLVAFIWSAEYTIKHIGERHLWRIYAWMIGVELLLIITAWFFKLL